MKSIRFGAREATWLVLAAGYVLMLAMDFPGHLSVDSIIELHEGRFHTRETWGPAIFPFILGLFDKVSPGTGLYLVASSLLTFGGWASLPQLRGRASWWLVPLAAAIVATPAVVIYQGIIWHDVLFAETAIAGFLLLAFAAKAWDGPRRPWIRLGLAVLSLSIASLVRQNGIVVLPIAALAVGWAAWGDGWRRAAGWTFAWFAAAVAMTAFLSVTALPQGPGFEKADAQGMRVLGLYDLEGALAQDPNLPLPRITAERPKFAQAMRQYGVRYYSPQRVDFLQESPQLAHKFKLVSTDAVIGDWKDLILKRPDLYWPMRLKVWRWVVATPVIDRCLPVYLGIDGPPNRMKDLGLEKSWGDREDRLYNYSTWFYDTPLMSHIAYAVLAAVLLAFFAWRRERTDGAMVAMLLAALAFTGSFLPVSLACDYRYLYFVDMAALTALLYFAADPRLRGRGLRPPP